MYCYTGILFVVNVKSGFLTQVYLQETAVTCMNNQGLTNLYESVVFYIQHQLVLFLGPSKLQAGSFNR